MINKRAYRNSRLRERRKKRRTVFIITGFFTLLIVCVIIVRSPYFQIQDSEVLGVKTVSSEVVKTITEKELTGTFLFIFPKNNVLWFPKAEIAKQISGNLGSVKKVSVGLSFPKKIFIDIDEHNPEAYICSNNEGTNEGILLDDENNECFLLDDGFVFATTTQENISKTSNLLYIKTEAPLKIKLKKQIISTEQFRYSTDLSKKLIQNNIPVEYITLNTNGDYRVRVNGGAELYFSDDIQLSDSIKNLVTLLSSEIFNKEGIVPPDGFKKIQYIDLRFGNKLFYKTKTGIASKIHETNP